MDGHGMHGPPPPHGRTDGVLLLHLGQKALSLSPIRNSLRVLVIKPLSPFFFLPSQKMSFSLRSFFVCVLTSSGRERDKMYDRI